jgi:hypothetical protein
MKHVRKKGEIFSADPHPILCSKERFCGPLYKMFLKNIVYIGFRPVDFFEQGFPTEKFHSASLLVLVELSMDLTFIVWLH